MATDGAFLIMASTRSDMRLYYQRRLDQDARVLEVCRNQISATEARPGQIRSFEARST